MILGGIILLSVIHTFYDDHSTHWKCHGTTGQFLALKGTLADPVASFRTWSGGGWEDLKCFQFLKNLEPISAPPRHPRGASSILPTGGG